MSEPTVRERFSINAWHQRKRALNKAAGRCINGPVTERGTQHAAPLPGHGKCAACVEAHRRSR